MVSPFAWLRRKAAESIALGVADGLAAVTPEGEEPPPDLAGLRQLVAVKVPAALAAAPDDEPKTRRKG
jgi:hypothetical protein